MQQNLSSGSQLEIDAAFQTLTLGSGMPGKVVGAHLFLQELAGIGALIILTKLR